MIRGQRGKLSARQMDISLLFDLAKNLTGGFDFVMDQQTEFQKIRSTNWKGSVWGDFSKRPALSKQPLLGNTSTSLIPIYPNSIEELLQLCFSRYRNNEYQHGFFLIKAEYGHDWFTPVLLHPHVIIRIPRSAKVSDTRRFLDPNESHVLMYLGSRIHEFCSIFYAVGLIAGVNTWLSMLTQVCRSVS
jgi:hypothetical protein